MKTNKQIINENKYAGELLKLIDLDIIRLKLTGDKHFNGVDEKGNFIQDYKTGEQVKEEIRSIIWNYINGLAKKVESLGGFGNED